VPVFGIFCGEAEDFFFSFSESGRTNWRNILSERSKDECFRRQLRLQYIALSARKAASLDPGSEEEVSSFLLI
jgi:hypothetical protein